MDSEIKTRFVKLPQREKQFLLARLINLLTISARAHYDASESERDEKLKRINETIHIASGKLQDKFDAR